MSDDGVKLYQTDPLLEQPDGSLGSQVAWLVSSVVLNGRLVMTVALVKLSLGTVAAWAAAGNPIAAADSVIVATDNPVASMASKRFI
jgi:hypothetical protein